MDSLQQAKNLPMHLGFCCVWFVHLSAFSTLLMKSRVSLPLYLKVNFMGCCLQSNHGSTTVVRTQWCWKSLRCLDPIPSSRRVKLLSWCSSGSHRMHCYRACLGHEHLFFKGKKLLIWNRTSDILKLCSCLLKQSWHVGRSSL